MLHGRGASSEGGGVEAGIVEAGTRGAAPKTSFPVRNRLGEVPLPEDAPPSLLMVFGWIAIGVAGGREEPRALAGRTQASSPCSTAQTVMA